MFTGYGFANGECSEIHSYEVLGMVVVRSGTGLVAVPVTSTVYIPPQSTYKV